MIAFIKMVKVTCDCCDEDSIGCYIEDAVELNENESFNKGLNELIARGWKIEPGKVMLCPFHNGKGEPDTSHS